MAHLNPIPKESFAGNMGISSAEWGVSMAMGRPKAALILRPEQREQLEGMASSRSLLAGLVSRARIILLSASGKTNLQIARHMGLTNATVGKWRRRFLEQDVSGLHDELRPGRPRPISDERVARLFARRWRRNRKTACTGRSGRSPKRRGCRNQRCSASGRLSG